MVVTLLYRRQLACYAETIAKEDEQRKDYEVKKANEEWAASHHYLISTTAQFGVYNSPFLP